MLSNRKALELRACFMGSLRNGSRVTTLRALFEGQHPEFRTRLTAKKLRVREQVIGK